MDVARRDDDLARALLRGYRAAGGDPGGDALLAFLCAVRALIRAKVDFLRAAQLTGAAADDRTARAIELLTVAERFAWRVRLPRVVCVTGRAASGKSTVAEALGRGGRPHRPVVRPDPQAARRHRPARPRASRARTATARAEPSTWSSPGARPSPPAMTAALIVDATFRRPTDADAFAATSPAAAAAAWLVCEAPPAVRLERARAREFQARSPTPGPAIVAAELATLPRPVPGAGAAAGPARHDAADRRRCSPTWPACSTRGCRRALRRSPPLHVVPDRSAAGTSQREGEDRPLSEHNSETDAEGAAVREARATGTPDVVVHDRYDRVHRAER